MKNKLKKQQLPVDSSDRNKSFTFEEGDTDKATVKQLIATACRKYIL